MTPMPEDEIDCGAVVAELYTFLDGELTESRRVQISAHMHGCVDCHETSVEARRAGDGARCSASFASCSMTVPHPSAKPIVSCMVRSAPFLCIT